MFEGLGQVVAIACHVRVQLVFTATQHRIHGIINKTMNLNILFMDNLRILVCARSPQLVDRPEPGARSPVESLDEAF
jgi:hypothetical protein